jgi:hypothetical protein
VEAGAQRSDKKETRFHARLGPLIGHEDSAVSLPSIAPFAPFAVNLHFPDSAEISVISVISGKIPRAPVRGLSAA